MVGLFDGKSEKEFIIQSGESIMIENMIWDYQKFLSEDSVLLVLCSTQFDENDYIGDIDEFKRLVNDG